MLRAPANVKPSAERAPKEHNQSRPLSARELECLRMIAMGLTDAQTAQGLGIVRTTVRFHLSNACRKLGAPNRCAAIYRAARASII